MSKKASKRELLSHAQRYIRAIMAEHLRKEGFVSKDRDDIHWYRIVNGEVVQSIYFITRHSYLPMVLEIGYGCHPLFITPEFPKGPYLYAMPGNEVICPGYLLLKESNQYCYAEEALVACPADGLYGFDILEKIFPILDNAITPIACYEAHRKQRDAQIRNNTWACMSTEFVDEVVFWEDRALYPFCENYINGQTKVLESALQKSKLTKIHQKELQNLKYLRSAIIEGKREEHLKLLEKRAAETIHLISKNTGLCF